MYIASLLLLLLLFQPRTPLLQSKLPPTSEGYVHFSPKKNKGNLDPHLCQQLITCSFGTNHQKTYWSTKKYSRNGKLNEKSSCTPINPKKYSCQGLKKNSNKEFVDEKKTSCGLKIPPPPTPITFLKVRPLSIHLLCLFLFLSPNGPS